MTTILLDPPPARSADSATELREAEISLASTDPPRPRARPDEPELFGGLPRLPPPRRGPWVAVAGFLQLAAVAVLVLVPLFGTEEVPLQDKDPLRILIYDPPPPPPPPLPKGSAEGRREKARAPAEPRPVPTPALVAPVTSPTPLEQAATLDESVGVTVEAPGSPQGSESGVPEGMEEGVPGGVVGGVPGGVVGGVIGGTGTGPVPVPVRDVDLAPRLLRQVRPVYPGPAFVKKVEGVVVVEILIDERGNVARARVVRSVALLDAAAVEAVGQWVFAPAQKHGRAVATIALAPVTFRIF